MMGIYNFEDHIVAGLEFAYHGIKLFLIRSRLPVDVRDDQARLESLQVSERAGAYRLDHHAGSMDAGDRCRRGILHDHAQLGFTRAAAVAPDRFLVAGC